MTSVLQKRVCPTQRNQASKALSGPSSYRLDQDIDQDPKDLLEANKFTAGPHKALARPP